MDDKGLDGLFKAENNIQSKTPPGEIWENIESDLKNTKRKRRGFIFWFTGFAILAIVATFLISQFEANENNTAITTNQSSQSQLSSDPKSGNETIENDQFQMPNAVMNNTDNLINSDNGVDEVTVGHENQDIFNKKPIKLKATLNSNIHFSKNSSLANDEEKRNESEKRNGNITFSSTSIISSSAISDQHNVENSRLGEFSSHKNEGEENIESHPLVSHPILGGINNMISIPHREISYLELDLDFKKRRSKPKSESELVNGLLCFIGGGSPDFFEYTNENIVLESTKDWYYIDFGVSYFRTVTSRLKTGVGIQLVHSKRKFNFEGDDLHLLSTSSFPLQYANLSSQGEQRFTFFDASIFMEYTLIKRNWNVDIGVSFLYNVHLSTSGKELDNNLQVARYNRGDEKYNSSIGIGYSPYISISRPIGKDARMFFSPRYTKYDSHLHKPKFGRELWYSSVGIDLGVLKMF